MSVVDPAPSWARGFRIGPFSSVGSEVELGDGVELVSHAVVAGKTTIGASTRIYPFASIGHPPQDVKYKGEPSTLAIGVGLH
jgi:UDP-N-acetylglucosamine acyltransferase